MLAATWLAALALRRGVPWGEIEETDHYEQLPEFGVRQWGAVG